MAHESRRRINNYLLTLGLQYECGREVAINGNCFVDSVLACIDNVRQTLPGYAKGIFTISHFREGLANFMGKNKTLHALVWFQRYKRATLEDKKTKAHSWEEYLDRVANTRDYVDQLQVMCTALFLNKDILQVCEDYNPENPWLTIPGQIEGWPIPSTEPPLRLAYFHKGEHYEPLKQKQQLTNPPGRVTRSSERKLSGTLTNQQQPSIQPLRVTRSHAKQLESCSQTSSIHAKSPAKRKLSPSAAEVDCENKSPVKASKCKSTETGASNRQAVATKLPKLHGKPLQPCKGCKFNGTSLLGHLKKKPGCAKLYDIAALQAEAKQLNREKAAARGRERYQNNPEESMKKKAASTSYYQRHKEKIALQRKLKFEQKTERERFLDFHNEMKNVCSYGCICCHRILTNTKDNKIKGGIEGLERDLKRKNETLFDRCIANVFG